MTSRNEHLLALPLDVFLASPCFLTVCVFVQSWFHDSLWSYKLWIYVDVQKLCERKSDIHFSTFHTLSLVFVYGVYHRVPFSGQKLSRVYMYPIYSWGWTSKSIKWCYTFKGVPQGIVLGSPNATFGQNLGSIRFLPSKQWIQFHCGYSATVKTEFYLPMRRSFGYSLPSSVYSLPSFTE